MRTVMLVLVLGVLCVLTAAEALADSMDFTFVLDGGASNSITDDTLTVSRTGLAINGITFDATLTVVGSADLAQNTSGLGVGNTRVNKDETLLFAMAVSNVVGGTVTFDGFAELDLNFFTGSDKADLSEDGSTFLTLSSTSDVVDIAGTAPATFLIKGLSGTGTTSFSVDSVKGSFTAAPVPEPGSLALLAVGLAACAVVRRLRRR